MKEFFVIYDVNTGYQTAGAGLVDKDKLPDGSTVYEWIQRKLAANADNRVSYFPAGTVFNPKTQMISNDQIIDIPQGQLDAISETKEAIIFFRNRMLQLFEMVMAIWDVGVSKGLWQPADVTEEIRQKVTDWKTYLSKL